MKKTLYILLVIIILVAGFFSLNSYIYNEKQAEGEIPELSKYFQEQMITLGVADIGQPIEGFDNNLLIMAFPGLTQSDFSGVETFEGYYEIQNGEAVFVRSQAQPISSAERTISEEGYATLLENISARLSFPVISESQVDELIMKINTGERLKVKMGETVSLFDVKVNPTELIEDSRCPANANCVWAGTVKVRATLESGLGTANQIFELNQTITTEAEEVTLVNVEPVAQSDIDIEDSEYIFYFEIKKR